MLSLKKAFACREDALQKRVDEENKDIFILRHYINLSVEDNFVYNNAKAGDRPEKNELLIRGDIYGDYKRAIQQNIINILNKEIANPLVN